VMAIDMDKRSLVIRPVQQRRGRRARRLRDTFARYV